MKRQKNWIKTLRQQRKMTQDEFTAKLQLAGYDYSRGAISAWETDRNQPPLNDPDFRRTLANILGVDVKYMLQLAGFEVERGRHSDEAEKAAYLIDRMPKDKRELVLRLVEQFVEV